ncbi:MAG: hypothetical protein KJ666_02245 [Bacteroidetes bacterium]|nr:hypothetical protein [Bacteroidota bacterium]MBU2585476.1 hypothetical protein [Bacteroidota bacterium]
MNTRKLVSSLLFFFMIVSLFSITSCTKSEDPVSPPDTSVPATIFPLVANRQIEYNGWLTQNDTETKIAPSEAGFYSKWFIHGTVPVNAIFPNPPFTNLSGFASLIRDTTKIPGVGVASKFTPFLIRYDSANASYDFLTNIGFFYRTFKVYTTGTTNIKVDSLRWIKLADTKSGLNKEFTAFDETFTGVVGTASVQVRLQVLGNFEAKETITVGTTSYETYRLVAKRKVFIGTTLAAEGLTAKLWLVNNVGPIQILLIGDAESHGKFQKMTAKNF